MTPAAVPHPHEGPRETARRMVAEGRIASHSAAPDLADALQAPPLARRIVEQIDRHASDLRLGADWRLMAAARILADPQIAAGRAAEATVAALRARHAEAVTVTDLGDVRMCTACHVRYPCADARMLAGEDPPTGPELTGFLG